MKKRKTWIYNLLPTVLGAGILIMLFTFSACDDDKTVEPEPTTPLLPTVAAITADNVLNVIQTTADFVGTVTLENGAEVVNRGVCWSTTNNPTIDLDTKTEDGTGPGEFFSRITGLTPNTTYYVKAYATNSVGTAYSNAISFKTNDGELVTDASGNVYQTVTIGTQTWMVENLKTMKYRNGDPIPMVTDDEEWKALSTGACCDYKNIGANGDIYGKLYNWYAVEDSRNLAPEGWRVATDEDWTTLTDYLGGTSIAGARLKEKGAFHWPGVNAFGTNEVGFTALPGGFRTGTTGLFVFVVFESGYWWTATEATASNGRYRTIPYNAKSVGRSAITKRSGYSVRCVKDTM